MAANCLIALCCSSPWAWSKSRRPSGAVLHSLRDPGVWRPFSDFVDMLRRLINCRIVIIIIIITANAGQCATFDCKSLLFWFPCKQRYIKMAVKITTVVKTHTPV